MKKNINEHFLSPLLTRKFAGLILFCSIGLAAFLTLVDPGTSRDQGASASLELKERTTVDLQAQNAVTIASAETNEVHTAR